MATERLVHKKRSASQRIDEMKAKYGDVVTLIQKEDRQTRAMQIFKRDHNRMVFWLCLAGMTEYEIATVFGVAEPTISVWKKTRPDFLAAMQAGRAEAVATAAHSLFRVGNGFSIDEEKLIPNRVKEYDPDTGKISKEYTEVLRVPVTRYFPPNVTALLKFLAAKYPEVWGDRSEVVHSGRINHSLDASTLSKKKLKMLQQIAKSSVEKDETLEKTEVKKEKKKKNKDKTKESSSEV